MPLSTCNTSAARGAHLPCTALSGEETRDLAGSALLAEMRFAPRFSAVSTRAHVPALWRNTLLCLEGTVFPDLLLDWKPFVWVGVQPNSVISKATNN